MSAGGSLRRFSCSWLILYATWYVLSLAIKQRCFNQTVWVSESAGTLFACAIRRLSFRKARKSGPQMLKMTSSASVSLLGMRSTTLVRCDVNLFREEWRMPASLLCVAVAP